MQGVVQGFEAHVDADSLDTVERPHERDHHDEPRGHRAQLAVCHRVLAHREVEAEAGAVVEATAEGKQRVESAHHEERKEEDDRLPHAHTCTCDCSLGTCGD